MPVCPHEQSESCVCRVRISERTSFFLRCWRESGSRHGTLKEEARSLEKSKRMEESDDEDDDDEH